MANSTDAALSRTPVRLRRQPRWLAAGVLAVTLGGLGTAYAVTSLVASDEVVRVTRTVHRGETLAASDLAVVSVSRSAGLSTVPASELSSLVGQVASTDLPGGSLIGPGTVGGPEVPPGMARVGLKLAPGRVPVAGLRPGASVLIVALQGPQESEEGVEEASVPATLAGEPVEQPDGSVAVDVMVAGQRAEAVARLAASDRVALVREGDAA
jgi:hypothetical protein